MVSLKLVIPLACLAATSIAHPTTKRQAPNPAEEQAAIGRCLQRQNSFVHPDCVRLLGNIGSPRDLQDSVQGGDSAISFGASDGLQSRDTKIVDQGGSVDSGDLKVMQDPPSRRDPLSPLGTHDARGVGRLGHTNQSRDRLYAYTTKPATDRFIGRGLSDHLNPTFSDEDEWEE